MRKLLSLLLTLSTAAVLAAPAAAPAPAAPQAATTADPTPTAPPPWAAALAEVERLARAGTPDLALARLDAAQPTAEADAEAWAAWQRVRLDILLARRDWKALVAATAVMPPAAPPPLQVHALTLRADALLELGDGAGARQVVTGLLWQAEGAPPAPLLDRWRRQLIRAYAVDALHQDAAIAIQRHRQDDARGAAQWSTLEAELLLRAGEPKRARAALGSAPDARTQLLATLADLRSGAAKPAAAFERAVALAVAKDRSSAARALAWSIAAEAAAAQDNAAARIAALEKALVAQGRDADPRAFMHVAPAAVWAAYREYGEALGNALELVVGSEQDWFVAASNRFDSEPVAARALSVVVATTAYEPEQRVIAHWQFAQLLARERDGGTVLVALYLDANLDPAAAPALAAVGVGFAEPERIPAPVRYLLLEPILALPDIPLASRLLAGLEAPPEGADPVEWHLRRARVFVLAGRVEEGVRALQQLLASGKGFELDRFLQVVFDLQTLEAHAAALGFLEPLLAQVEEPQRKRELAFWTADSRAALGAHAEAARLYLLSATATDPFAMDPWAQTARYRAAQELAHAGLRADARRQYGALLNATSDPARQAVLRHELQQLALEEARAGTP